MKKSGMRYSIITLLILLITHVTIRSIGIEDISTQAIGALFIIA